MKILANLIIAANIVFGCSFSVPQPNNVINEHQPEKLENFISGGWYVSPPLSVEEIEQEAIRELVRYQQSPNARKDVPMAPFGFANDEWNVFKSKVEPGDEIRKITAPSEYWQRLAGWEGHALVRAGLIIWQAGIPDRACERGSIEIHTNKMNSKKNYYLLGYQK